MTPCPFSHFYIMYNHIPIDPYRFLGPLWSIVPLSHRFSVLRRRCWGVSTISVHRTSKRRTNDANDKMKWHRSRLLWMRHQKKIYEHLKRACARRNAYTCLVDIVSCSGIFGEYWPISFLWFTFSIFKMVEKQPNQQRYRWSIYGQCWNFTILDHLEINKSNFIFNFSHTLVNETHFDFLLLYICKSIGMASNLFAMTLFGLYNIVSFDTRFH